MMFRSVLMSMSERRSTYGFRCRAFCNRARIEVHLIQEISMSEAVRITTPVLSVEETARIVGVPLSRAKELVELADRVSRKVSSRSLRRPTASKGATRRARSTNGTQ